MIPLFVGACQSEPALPPTANAETWRAMRDDARAPRSPGDGGGVVRKVGGPDEVVAGQPIALAAELEVGPHGIAVGGAIVVTPSPFWGWTPPQTRQPGAPGATTLQAPDGATLTLEDLPGMVVATVGGRALVAGERVRVDYGVGDTARADRFAETSPALWIGVDADGDGVRSVVPQPITVTVRPGPAAGLVVTLPSAAHPGDTVTLRVAAVDAIGNGPARLGGELHLTGGPSEALSLVDGLATLPWTLSQPGVYRVQVEGPDGIAGLSNPMVVRDGAEVVRWLDLQVHGARSDGTGTPEELFRYGRDVAGLDGMAVTEHDHWGMVYLDRDPEGRAAIAAATDAAYAPGAFVTVHGYEWTDWASGHRHVLWFDGPGDWRSSLDPATDTPPELLAALLAGQGGRDVLVVRHHPAGGPVATDWSVPLDPALEPVVEIASVHGQSESRSLPGPIYDSVPGAFVDQVLAAGDASFGFLGSTDGHDGHPGLSQLAGGVGGLTAVLGADLTRESLYAAIRARRTYATNGPRIVLRVDAGGAPMGGEIPPGSGPVPLEVRVVGTAPIDHVEVVRRSGVVGSLRGAGSATAHGAWTLDPIPGDLVWVRVVQEDGGLAWSSPIRFAR